MQKLNVSGVAVSLYKNHGFEPDVAYSAAYAWLNGRLATASYAQAISRMQRVRIVPKLNKQQIDAVLAAYRIAKGVPG